MYHDEDKANGTVHEKDHHMQGTFWRFWGTAGCSEMSSDLSFLPPPEGSFLHGRHTARFEPRDCCSREIPRPLTIVCDVQGLSEPILTADMEAVSQQIAEETIKFAPGDEEVKAFPSQMRLDMLNNGQIEMARAL